jgi:hypothetical protein
MTDTATRQRWNSPALPMVATLPLTIAFVVLRWLDAGHRQLGNFVLAGSKYVTKNPATRGLPIRTGSGYDGQFYYRLGLDPFKLQRVAFGIRFDSVSRTERIGYPFLAWALALGHHDRIPFTLVAVNVLAAAVLGLAGGLVAKSAGRPALWGLVFPLYWGYLWTLGRDLTELTTAALVMLALAAFLRDRPWWAGLALLGAIVSKETSVLLVGTLALSSLWLRARPATTSLALSAPGRPDRLTLRRADAAWVVPLVGFVGWQLLLFGATGRLPIYKSGGENLGAPLVGFVHGVAHYVSLFPSIASALWFAELALLVVLIAATTRLRGHAPREFEVLWIVSVVLGACAATGIWLGDVGFRSLDDIYLTSWVVLLFHPGRLTPLLVLCGGAWLVVAVELIRFI